MVIKILDRYLIGSYLFAYVVVFISLVMMVVLFDFVLSIDEFFRDFGKTDDDGNPLGPQTVIEVVGDISGYYAVHSTHYFSLLSGFIAVIAAGFVLARMNYTNELTAVLASGVSLHRVLRPIALCGFALNLLLVVDQEYVMPALRDRLLLDRDDQAGRRAFEVWGFRDNSNSMICAGQFNPEQNRMLDVLIVERTQPAADAPEGTVGRAFAIIKAEEAIWEPDVAAPPNGSGTLSGETSIAGLDDRPGRWKLVKAARILRDSAFGNTADLAAVLADDDPTRFSGDLRVTVYPVNGATTDMTPARLRQHQYAKYLDFLSFNELGALAKRPQISNAQRAELQVRQHLRITQPIGNMLLLLAAVPLFLNRERRNLIVSSVCAIAIVGGGLGLGFMAGQWAFEQADPEYFLLGAWLPIAVYAPLAAISVESIRT